MFVIYQFFANFVMCLKLIQPIKFKAVIVNFRMQKKLSGGINSIRKAIDDDKHEEDPFFKTFRPFEDERNALGRLLPPAEDVRQEHVRILRKTKSEKILPQNLFAQKDRTWRKNEGKNIKPNYSDYCTSQLI